MQILNCELTLTKRKTTLLKLRHSFCVLNIARVLKQLNILTLAAPRTAAMEDTACVTGAVLASPTRTARTARTARTVRTLH